jgi:16S rRNA (cytosine1402-N4)-methyltransferase
LDADPQALQLAAKRLQPFEARTILVNENFTEMKRVALERGIAPVDGVLFDLGVSSMQLETAERGFSFRMDAPLDMRLDPRRGETARDLVSELPEQELAAIIARYGEERWAKAISRAIVRAREKGTIETTVQLAKIIERVVPAREKIHPATRTFQALRIAVNHELENIENALGQAVDILEIGGRLAVISFHSLEDRLVKQFMVSESRGCICPPRLPVCTCGHRARLSIVVKKPIVPTLIEVRRNPRSRSAKLRVASRIE